MLDCLAGAKVCGTCGRNPLILTAACTKDDRSNRHKVIYGGREAFVSLGSDACLNMAASVAVKALLRGRAICA